MNNTTKYHSLIIAVVVLFAMMTVSCEKSPEDNGNGTDETDRMIDIRTSIEALTKSPALDGNGEGNFSNGGKFLQRGYLYACGFRKRFPEYRHKLHCRDD